ncbi:hypothetical protein BHE74_00015229, partial [Ensete ventricosum]
PVPIPTICRYTGTDRAVHIPVNHRTGTYHLYRTVESAFEFARICRKLDFHNFVFSMKASNPVVMVQAYRLLVAEMYVQGWDYPLHLGVTEAGEGEDGRMKSAIGIGTLLQDGLGDTIRVSLTEPPEEEIDPCRRLANLGMQAVNLQKGTVPFEEKHRRYFDFQRRSGQLPVQKEVSSVFWFSGLICVVSFLTVATLSRVRKWTTVIAIMGCIVNGPGEMADADFGYVGGSPGKIDLYVGKVSAVLSKITTFELHCEL